MTVIFVLVASAASGALAVSSFTAVTAYRERAFVDRTEFQAVTTAALVRSDVEPADIEDRLAAFGETLTADVIAVNGPRSFVSTPFLSPDLVPASLANKPRLNRDTAEVRIGTTDYRVVGLTAELSNTRLYFFFSRTELQASLRELATILVVAWVAVTGLAATVGVFVARRTLRPVRSAADAAHAVAEGLLDTRLPVSGSDEFATLARSFNEMAHALQAKLDELSAAHERERRFTGDVAHELMTPLGALVTEASVLEAHLDELPPTARRMSELLVTDIRRLRVLVEELLELARLDASTAVDASEPVRIGDLLPAIIRSAAQGVVVATHGDVDASLITNRGCVERVLSNLLRNAVHHGAGRSIEVRVAATATWVDLEVRDRGPGIAADHLPHVFDRFYKADISRSTSGTGLGLAIAAEYARLLGAELTAGNVADGGAVFTFRLPRVQPS